MQLHIGYGPSHDGCGYQSRILPDSVCIMELVCETLGLGQSSNSLSQFDPSSRTLPQNDFQGI